MANKMLKRLVMQVREEAQPIIGSALQTGARRVAAHLAEASSNRGNTSDLLLGGIAAALRSGLIAAGHEMMNSGLNRVRQETGAVEEPPVLSTDTETQQ